MAGGGVGLEWSGCWMVSRVRGWVGGRLGRWAGYDLTFI